MKHQHDDITAMKRQAGYNLIEVLIAMSLIGTVLLSVMSLFFLSRRNVYSGKQLTQAVAMGTHALEDISQLNTDDLYTAFAITSATTLGTYTIGGVTYTNSIIRSTDATIVSSPPADIGAEQDPDGAPNGFLTTWRTEIVDNLKFKDGSVSVLITPKNPVAVMDATNATRAAKGVKQVRIIVRWDENGRIRLATFDTAKVKR